jgi:hypothetical protein
MDGVIDCVFNHPNAGPFLASRLIRLLVTSNPSPAYSARVAQVFNSNSNGIRATSNPWSAQFTGSPVCNDQPYPPRAGSRIRGHVCEFLFAQNGRISLGQPSPDLLAAKLSPRRPPSSATLPMPPARQPRAIRRIPDDTPTESILQQRDLQLLEPQRRPND